MCLLAVSQCCRRWFLGKTRRRAAWASLKGVVLVYREAVSSRLYLKVPKHLHLVFFPSDYCRVLSCLVLSCSVMSFVSMAVLYVVSVAVFSGYNVLVLFDSSLAL